jgi:hypothetical protein
MYAITIAYAWSSVNYNPLSEKRMDLAVNVRCMRGLQALADCLFRLSPIAVNRLAWVLSSTRCYTPHERAHQQQHSIHQYFVQTTRTEHLKHSSSVYIQPHGVNKHTLARANGASLAVPLTETAFRRLWHAPDLRNPGPLPRIILLLSTSTKIRTQSYT